jgi:hypothetical protein
MKPGRWILAALLTGVLAWGAATSWRKRRTDTAAAATTAPAAATTLPSADDTTARAPEGVRVRVQVINATTTNGLARRATRWLRDRGFDVVEIGTTRDRLDSSLVLDRSGHPDWARRAARALGGARVEARPDSSRYLDLTVLIGRAWRPPTEALDP